MNKEYIKFREKVFTDVYGGHSLPLSKRISLRYFNPSTNAVLLIHQMQYWHTLRHSKNVFVCKLASVITMLKYNKLAKTYGIFVNPDVELGVGLKLPHPTGIVIGSKSIGNHVTIYQQVTIGSARIGDYLAKGGAKQPVIGNDVVLFSGSKIIGEITVADGSCIGANAVLTKSTSNDTTYVGVPARKTGK